MKTTIKIIINGEAHEITVHDTVSLNTIVELIIDTMDELGIDSSNMKVPA